MQPGGIHRQREIQMVVDDQRHAACGTQRLQRAGLGQAQLR